MSDKVKSRLMIAGAAFCAALFLFSGAMLASPRRLVCGAGKSCGVLTKSRGQVRTPCGGRGDTV